jgi:hypothetical protein
MKKIILILSVIVVVVSCKKENSNEFFPYPGNDLNDTNWYSIVPSSAKVRQLDSIFNEVAFSDSMHIMQGGTLIFNDSPGLIRIFFPPYFCMIPGTIIQGKVKIEVKLLKTKGDMVKTDRPTMSYGSLLVTGGALHIRATYNGQELPMTQGASLDIEMISKMSNNNAPSQNMKIFYGKENAYPSTAVQTFTWLPSTDSANRAWAFTDSSTQRNGYYFQTTRFGWVNCDYFSDSSQPRTKAVVTLPPNFTNANTNVYAVLHSPDDIVAQLMGDAVAKNFSISNIYTGKLCTFVTLSYINGNLYLGSTQTTITQNMNVNIAPQQKTKQQIESFLDNL